MPINLESWAKLLLFYVYKFEQQKAPTIFIAASLNETDLVILGCYNSFK